ncbi:MAG: response regulator [Candidatus Marinimicrobia bacterium]|nr:response regulator [Candidatus Neomarinimicrobiota bacterium]
MKEYKILIVDDEPSVCNFLSDYLKYKGYNSKIALSGKEALAALNTEHFDLVLLDLIMPKMNGLEVLERIKKIDLRVPIIILTSVKDKNITESSLEMGAVDFISKPIDIERLEESITINISNILL